MGLKRRKIGLFRRIKGGWKAGVTTAVSGTGVSAPFVTGLGAAGLELYGGALLAASLLVAYVRGKMKHLPAQIVEELSKENHYEVRPCTHENLKRACEETEALFGRDAVDFEILENWRQAFPNGFIEMTNNVGDFCGCFIFLPLTNSFTDEFIGGRHSEHQICADVIIRPPDHKKAKRVYVCGIMVVGSGTQLGFKRTAVLVSASAQYVHKVLGKSKRLFYTVPITKEGQSLVTKLGFKVISPSSERTDKHDLYSLELAGPGYASLIAQFGDYSPIVKITV